MPPNVATSGLLPSPRSRVTTKAVWVRPRSFTSGPQPTIDRSDPRSMLVGEGPEQRSAHDVMHSPQAVGVERRQVVLDKAAVQSDVAIVVVGQSDAAVLRGCSPEPIAAELG